MVSGLECGQEVMDSDCWDLAFVQRTRLTGLLHELVGRARRFFYFGSDLKDALGAFSDDACGILESLRGLPLSIAYLQKKGFSGELFPPSPGQVFSTSFTSPPLLS